MRSKVKRQSAGKRDEMMARGAERAFMFAPMQQYREQKPRLTGYGTRRTPVLRQDYARCAAEGCTILTAYGMCSEHTPRVTVKF